MYTLLSGAYRHYFQKDEYCILILGLDDAGKTTFLEQTKTKFSKGKNQIHNSLITPIVSKRTIFPFKNSLTPRFCLRQIIVFGPLIRDCARLFAKIWSNLKLINGVKIPEAYPS